jgi:hypothetical protein
LYVLGQNAATEVLYTLGPDQARKFMYYTPGSTILERCYDQDNFNLPVMEIAMDGDIAAAQKDMAIAAFTALTKNEDHTHRKS